MLVYGFFSFIEQNNLNKKSVEINNAVTTVKDISILMETARKDDVVYYIEQSLEAMQHSPSIKGKENNIFPVIRSTSFPRKTPDGKRLVYKDHTAETRIFYALDLDQSYKLIDKSFLEKEKLTPEALHEMALFNLRSLPVIPKEDHVADNTFYFINYNDGYDASRILDQSLIESMAKKMEGDFAIAVPHQDVLIFADIKNNRGYDILAQMAMSFFVNGNIPITALPFLWEEHKLQPIFILAKNRPIDEED